MQNGLLLLTFMLTAVNIFSFVLVGVDKKRSLGSGERFPEVYLFFMAILFGSLGVFLGLFAFRHKTKKAYFPLGIGLLLIEQMLLIILVSNLS